MSRNILPPPDAPPTRFHGMLTVAPEMAAFFTLVERVARADSTVLVRGETGTGKELVARALHDLGPRATRPFHAINCATLTPELLASELFGHVRGAFTGAVRDRKGLFAQADGGSVFLDEVAEMNLQLQSRLLRVLAERTFVPVGGARPVAVDVRVISATNKSLRREVEERRFREDLMYRIRVVPLFLPPLRERSGDIEALAWSFIAQLNERGLRRVDGIAPRAMDAMLAYPWPGNVRELANAVEHAFVLGADAVIQIGDLPPELRGEEPARGRGAASELSRERQQIVNALRRTNGKKGEAAKRLGMSRSTLWRKLREFGLS